MPTLEELMPRNEELGPQNQAYLERIQPLLPEFPAEVLGSWFSEHPASLKTYYPLGLENFRFRLERWTAAAIGGEEILRAGTTLAKLTQDLNITNRLVRDGMAKTGTWTVPPIVLDVENSVIPPTFQHPVHEKRQLLEGHHRFAMAMQLIARDGPVEHNFWMVTIEAPHLPTEP